MEYFCIHIVVSSFHSFMALIRERCMCILLINSISEEVIIIILSKFVPLTLSHFDILSQSTRTNVKFNFRDVEYISERSVTSPKN